jgi:hypothetical protein
MAAREGTGKTTAYIEMLIAFVLTYTGKRALILIPRLSVLNHLYHALQGRPILSHASFHRGDSWNNRSNLILITPDSLHLIPPDVLNDIELLIIDEAELFCLHIASKVVDRPTLFYDVEALIKRVNTVLLLDIYLSPYVQQLMLETAGNKQLMQHRHGKEVYPVSIGFVPTKEALFYLIDQALASGAKCYVFTETKLDAIRLFNYFVQKYNLISLLVINDEDKPVLSDNQREALATFMADPNNEARKYSLIVASPKLLCGTDISIENHFDRVFGIFCGYITIPSQLFQGVRRVRAPINNQILVYAPDNKGIKVNRAKVSLDMLVKDSVNGSYSLRKDLNVFEKISILRNEEMAKCQENLKAAFITFLEKECIPYSDIEAVNSLKLCRGYSNYRKKANSDLSHLKVVIDTAASTLNSIQIAQKSLIEELARSLNITLKDLTVGSVIDLSKSSKDAVSIFVASNIIQVQKYFNVKLSPKSKPLRMMKILVDIFGLKMTRKDPAKKTYNVVLKKAK